MPYLTRAEAEEILDAELVGDEDSVARLLKRATRDIDNAVGRWALEADGTKFGDLTADLNPKGLSTTQSVRLKWAVANQAEFRQSMGEDFFIEDQRETVEGPDFTESGRLPRVGPKAREELIQSGLLRMTGRMT